jgi:hypothetical protein
MPKKEMDYSKCVIYKITCLDTEITECYVGHTTNFIQRKSNHKSQVKDSDLKLYKMIRDNGGWYNWKMEVIMEYPCESLLQAKRKEQECLTELKAQLNMISAHAGDFNCELCDYSTKLRADWNKHVNTKIHIHIQIQINDMRKRMEDLKTRHDEMKERHDEMRKRHDEIVQRREDKSPRYDSIDDVRSAFFLNSMFMNQDKKDYKLQDFGKWIVMNRMVCKSIENK